MKLIHKTLAIAAIFGVVSVGAVASPLTLSLPSNCNANNMALMVYDFGPRDSSGKCMLSDVYYNGQDVAPGCLGGSRVNGVNPFTNTQQVKLTDQSGNELCTVATGTLGSSVVLTGPQCDTNKSNITTETNQGECDLNVYIANSSSAVKK